MYFVDREKIAEILAYINKQVKIFEENNVWESLLERAALERISHTTIEAILDVGNAIIDGFIMRDPGSYEDIIDIFLDEKVIDEEMSLSLKKVIALRSDLVQEFISIDHEKIEKVFKEQLTALKQFAPAVDHYLETELGPVSAFQK